MAKGGSTSYSGRKSEIFTEQKIRNVHGFDSFVVATCEIVRHQHIFRIVVMDFKKTVIFALLGFGRLDFLGYLNIQFFTLPFSDKVYFTVLVNF